jgi:hypothetical protein
MNGLFVKEVNAETGEEIVREMNEQELSVIAEDEAKAKAEIETKKQKAIEKAALLEKLGITADEAKLLLS